MPPCHDEATQQDLAVCFGGGEFHQGLLLAIAQKLFLLILWQVNHYGIFTMKCSLELHQDLTQIHLHISVILEEENGSPLKQRICIEA